jgi:hypothetical protein
LLGSPTASADASGYTLVQCHVSNRGTAEAVSSARGPYSTQDRCDGGDQRLQITNAGFAGSGQVGVWAFTAPVGTVITGLRLDANLRRDNHHLAQVVAVDDAGNTSVLVNGPDSGEGFRGYGRPDLAPARVVRLQLFCGQPSGCAASDVAHAYARNIEITLRDTADPVISSVSGSLLTGGWLRGFHSLTAQASDAGSGLQSLVAYVNGTEIARAPITCSGWLGGANVTVFSPCPVAPAGAFLSTRPSTVENPFRDGLNELELCTADFAGNRPACETRGVHVDNSPPYLAFENAGDPNDPELVSARVHDMHSGIDRAELLYRPVGAPDWRPLAATMADDRVTTRVHSAAVPPGEYEFAARASDVAGNTAETTRRSDGRPMVLTFPLRPAPSISAHLLPGGATKQTLAYGRNSSVAGRLRAPDGSPVAGAEVRVEEYFGSGALIDRRVRTVTTAADGSWSSTLPAGPSRTVTASYSGSRQYGAAESGSVSVDILGRATFRTSRTAVPEGSRIVFSGRIGHAGARIPAGGKLIELQVKETANRWNTVREAFHTGPDGRYRLGYRFGRFYQTDARFRFRVKIAREQGWPYKAPARSRSRTVTVRAG